jgi:hypothetical protein
MFRKISLLVPTRGRLGHLAALLASYEQTVQGCEDSSEIVFRVDQDDVGTMNYLDRAIPYVRQVVTGPSRGYGSHGSLFNDCVPAADGDVLMVGNDDMVFKTRGWAPRLLEVASQFEDGIFDLGVSTFNAGHFPFIVVSRRAVNAIGALWPDGIFWGDIFWRDVMATLGRCLMVPDVEVVHDWAGKPYDVTHDRPDYWGTTHSLAVAAAAARLREIMQ